MQYLKINTLEKGWFDKDEVLLHTAFQLLIDFIEQEEPDKIVDWNANKLHRKVWKEIKLFLKKKPKIILFSKGSDPKILTHAHEC